MLSRMRRLTTVVSAGKCREDLTYWPARLSTKSDRMNKEARWSGETIAAPRRGRLIAPGNSP